MDLNLVKSYFIDNLKKGYTIELISSNLKNSGYTDDIIKQAVALLDQNSKNLSVENSKKFDYSKLPKTVQNRITPNQQQNAPQQPGAPGNQPPAMQTAQPPPLEKHPGLDKDSLIKYGSIIGGVLGVIVIGIIIFSLSSDDEFSSGGPMDRYADAIGLDDDVDSRDSSSELDEPEYELQDGCSEFSENLKSCSSFECFFNHPFTNTEMKREILSMKDGHCLYEEEMPNDSYMSCRFPIENLEDISDYYKLMLQSEEISDSVEVSFHENEPSETEIPEFNLLDFCDFIMPEDDSHVVPAEPTNSTTNQSRTEKTCETHLDCFDGDVRILNQCDDGICRMVRDDGRPCISNDGYCPPRCYGYEFNDSDCLDNQGRVLCTNDEQCNNFDNMTEDYCHRFGYCDHFEIELPNNPPVITSTPILEAIEYREYKYQVEATDEDGDNLTFSLAGDYPDNMTINSETGLILWYPGSDDYSSGEFRVVVSDGRDSDEQDLHIMVYMDEAEDHIRSDVGEEKDAYLTLAIVNAEYRMCKYLNRYWENAEDDVYTCISTIAFNKGNESICNYLLDGELINQCKLEN